jgi:polyhydroxyalkanoate synthesis repressor PhaR
MTKPRAPVVIKKYPNQRLYNPGTGAYLAFDDLAGMVENEEDFIVYDAGTGEDITRSVLAGITVETGPARGRSRLH